MDAYDRTTSQMGDENETRTRLSQRATDTLETPAAGPTSDVEPPSAAEFSTGMILGGRFRVEQFLGRGGMGEVWRALDLKLRVEVALKSISDKLKSRSQALEYLRREVRAARQVNSPNVCRIHDLLDVDDRELVSMEFVDGVTVLELCRSRGSMDLHEAGQFAAQFLGGLEAIHQAGLVHRDLKPENVMITRSGRVVIMDLGLAKATVGGAPETVAGTVPYMSPEQLAGKPLGPESDIFASGVLLAELVDPRGVGDLESRRAIWDGVHDDPPSLADSPWRTALTQAVARQATDRYPSARAFARALEEVVLRVQEAESETPYLGLAAFTEAEAEFFFGREAEVEALWKKLSQAHLLAVIGASGAGKSSFVRAGVLAAKPEGWGCVVCKPRTDPFVSLARALVTQFSGDEDALQQILQFDDLDVAEQIVARWRKGHAEALIVIDQFEELFTLNPPDVQARFSELIGRIATGQGDTHVLIVSRDDFLIRCHALPALAPLFSDLTPLGPPAGESLRRAVVQPALRCGYRFEDESLLEEILGSVADERAALPLLAFAITRLWELREKETGLLTRKAYAEIGGVSGALAQHAEATLEWIGPARVPIVRELFRNLVTAQGTRVARGVAELLTLFDESELDREAAKEALSQLVDARLLTTYDAPSPVGDDAGAPPQVEIVHESLLSSWPRLVRWRTQDADGAQLHDELRQTAELWAGRERPEDLLWTGSSLTAFELWRERHPVALTATEEAFSDAMRDKARRSKRNRRLALMTVLASLLAVVMGVTSLWQRSEAARRSAEASQLMTLGRSLLIEHPSAALAYAIASLERADDGNLRRFALEALWSGPSSYQLHATRFHARSAAFSPDGKWLATGSDAGRIELWSAHGGEPRVLSGHQGVVTELEFDSSSDLLVSVSEAPAEVRVWSVANGNLQRKLPIDEESRVMIAAHEPSLFLFRPAGQRTRVSSLSLRQGNRRELGDIASFTTFDLDGAGRLLAFARDGDVYLTEVGESRLGKPRRLSEHEAPVRQVAMSGDGTHVASLDQDDVINVWPVEGSHLEPQRSFRGPKGTSSMRFDSSGSTLSLSSYDNTVRLYDLTASPATAPLQLRRGDVLQMSDSVFSPNSHWLATLDALDVALWDLGWPHPRTLRGHKQRVTAIAFASQGDWLASTSTDGSIRRWSSGSDSSVEDSLLYENADDQFVSLDIGPKGKFLVAGGRDGRVLVVPTDGGPLRSLQGFSGQVYAVACDPTGRWVAASGGQLDPSEAVIRMWNLESNEVRLLDPGDGQFISDLAFLSDGRLISAGRAPLRLWHPDSARFEILHEIPAYFVDVSADDRYVVAVGSDFAIRRLDLEKGTQVRIGGHGAPDRPSVVALGPDGNRVASADYDGTIRVGEPDDAAPHLLLGHESTIYTVAFDAAGKWLATGGDDGSVRLWPVPEGRSFSTLPLHDALELLRSRTNVRIVADPADPSGYDLTVDAFPGWNP